MKIRELLTHLVQHPVASREGGSWEVDVDGNQIVFWPSCTIALGDAGTTLTVKCNAYVGYLALRPRTFSVVSPQQAFDYLDDMLDAAEECRALEKRANDERGRE